MSNHTEPLISVIMPVYNAGLFLRQAIDSILMQSVRDFEFLIIDDCSADASREIVAGYDDPRITLITNTSNLGVARTLNKGLELAKGDYIARMDADDLSEPKRFATQVAFMNEYPQLAISGSWVWRQDGTKKFLLRYPVGRECVESFLLFGNPLAHPTVFMRRHKVLELGQYDPECPAAQDYDFWSRCFQQCAMDNVARPLVSWRCNPDGVTMSGFDSSNKVSLDILKRMLGKLEITVNEEELLFHREVGNGSGARSFEELEKIHNWLMLLLKTNGRKRIFSDTGLRMAAAFAWNRVCLNSSWLGLGVISRFIQSPFRKWYKPGLQEIGYLVANTALKRNKEPTGRLVSS